MPAIDQDELLAFVDSVRRLLADRSTEADVRRTMESPEGHDPALWRELASIGVAGLLVDAQHGGVGAGPVELERVMEEMGAVLACTPMLSSGVLAASLLQALDDADAQARLLPGIADGSRIATVALTGAKGGWTEGDVAVTARQGSDGWRLDGKAGYVTHGHVAGLLLVVARTPDGIGVFELPAGAPGAQLKALPVFDRTQPMAELSLQDAPAHRLACARPGWEAVEAALDLARVALAGEQAGAARRVLEATVAYAQDRFQFGRAIGSFQAIKHMAADLLLESESCTSAARHAARCLADGDAEAPQAVCLAAFACADAFSTVAATSIQMHGGIAFTWAHPAHLYLRRARADAQLFGTPAAYRERYVQLLEAQA